MKKVIFFLRHNNDIDHISPVIYKWIISKNIPIDIIITSQKDFLEDYRILYLKKQVKLLERNDVHFCYFGYLQKTQKALEKYFKDNIKCLVCLDWNSDEFTRQIYRVAKEYQCNVIALPHGDEPYWNEIQRESDISYVEANQPYIQQQFFDYIVVPNTLCQRRYKHMKPEQVKVLGSPRYCNEWLKINDTIKPQQPVIGYKNQLKIVLFLRNKHWNINWHEVYVYIKLLTRFTNVHLIVRNHPRGKMTYNLLKNHPDLRYIHGLTIDSSMNSSSLIDWSDIVLDVGTSICWEAVKKNKPIYMLENLHANESTIAHYMPDTIIHSRDELLDALRKFYKNKHRKWCKESKRQKFIKEIIDCPDKNVLERYCKFLESILNG